MFSVPKEDLRRLAYKTERKNDGGRIRCGNEEAGNQLVFAFIVGKEDKWGIVLAR